MNKEINLEEMENSDMNTDQISKKLFNQALDRETEKIKSASRRYNNEIGLSGTYEEITLVDHLDKTKTINILTTEIYKAIENQLIKKRKEKIKTQAVNDFLNFPLICIKWKIMMKAYDGYRLH